MPPRASIIISTHDQPRILELALASYARQSRLDFELLVADSGSSTEAGRLVRELAVHFPVRLEHVWHADARGDRTEALNRAALRSRGALLIFASGNAVVPPGFVETHLRARRRGRYSLGGHVRLAPDEIESLTPGELPRRRRRGLAHHALDVARITFGRPEGPELYCQNFSVDRESFFRVNGCDQRYPDPTEQELNLRLRLQLAGLHPRALGMRSRIYLVDPATRRLTRHDGPKPVDDSAPDLQAEAALGLRELAERLRPDAAQTPRSR